MNCFVSVRRDNSSVPEQSTVVSRIVRTNDLVCSGPNRYGVTGIPYCHSILVVALRQSKGRSIFT